MTHPQENYGQRPVQPSHSKRNLSGASRNHLTGLFVFGDGDGRVVGSESHLEFNFALCLAAHPDTADLHEQVPFEWRDLEGKAHKHYFDFVVSCVGGKRVAYTVKPVVGLKGTFAETMPHIAQQARESGHFSDVRLLTDADLDQVSLFNAKLLHACRAAQPEHDLAALRVVQNMTGVTTLGALVAETGLQGNGFRAMVRLLRSGHLKLRDHEHISYEAAIYKAKQP
ncbi:hypothetical protein EOK75_00575 [Pseudorhodobacter turbinis]|uniref:TnsA endonuclease N-terminal domain-containing protein n=1 Tax=Pseudorhodobacter turbinis TaxID=2500533 RepID=A0A4V1E0F4_9RHOB|nr:hypothetical protein [Pseudorhodobacter turbinis]QCO54444.1 hypothetical protein EOK75_00575 [Pseudorhodobacter turbinis]